MEIKVLYVILMANGEKKYYGTEIDRNNALNMMKDWTRSTVITYEIKLEKF